MSNKAKIYKALTTALMAMAFSASGLTTIGSALSVSMARPLWLASALGAAACGLMAFSGISAVLALAGLGLISGGYILSHLPGMRAIPAFFAAWQSGIVSSAQMNVLETLLICAALVMAMLFFLLLYQQGLSGLAIMLLASMLVFSHGMSARASIAATVPGLVAGAMAFALSDLGPRDALPLRVLIPSILAVALALMLSPASRVTWPPMEELANRVRNVFEQYFNFTHERIAFSISEEGYNHGGEVDGQPVAMLGGPANPDPNPVMRVTADGDLLLRGTIRSTYTGYSWIDVTSKNRYLYFDLTHRAVRDRVFNLNYDNTQGFDAVSGQVELLDSSTSTLFVPGRLNRFDMDLSNAVYYNSSGEMFMAREAQTGDVYGVESLNPIFSEAFRQAAIAAENANDSQYDAILAAHSQLPSGVEPGLMQLTAQLTTGADNAYDRAMAIAGYLRRNMRYKLDVEYPPQGRDFASWFVLESKEGYCSYFATAMAVMGRLAGLPTRYVEGYYARVGAGDTVTLTGMDAHAWAEVYFKGMGWIPFDATNGGPGHGDAGTGGGNGEERFSFGTGEENTEQTPFEDKSENMDGETEDDASEPPEENNSEENSENDTEDDNEENSEDNPEENPEDDNNDTPEEDETPPPDDPDPESQSGNTPWFLIPLLLLALLILAAIWVKKRLEASDPMALCGKSRRAQQAAMIAYRANLTLLAHMGQSPQNGETPDAFVQRICKELDNPDYVDFVQAISYSRYGGRPMKKENVELGLRAYRRFLRGLRPMERLRFTLTRIIRGLGDFENIP